jgi:hypothetical protein
VALATATLLVQGGGARDGDGEWRRIYFPVRRGDKEASREHEHG